MGGPKRKRHIGRGADRQGKRWKIGETHGWRRAEGATQIAEGDAEAKETSEHFSE